jgi:hypothetical protein
VADLNSVAGDFDSEGTQELFGKRAGGNAGSGFTGGSAFEDVASIVEVEFL